MAESGSAPDLGALNAGQRAIWASGDFAVVGTPLQIVAEVLCEAMDLRSGMRVLDVCAGHGNASLAAARRWCEVTSTDFVPAVLDRGRIRAEAEGLSVRFQEADAENLPFKDGAFDAVLSTFGVMFAPDQAKAASEILRVVRPGGRIGLANWTPTSFSGKRREILGKYLPQPAGAQSADRWGTRERLDELFAASAASIQVLTKHFVFRYRSPAHWLEVFRTSYGPMITAFAALNVPSQAALANDLIELASSMNQSGDETLVLPAEYLEVVIVKKT